MSKLWTYVYIMKRLKSKHLNYARSKFSELRVAAMDRIRQDGISPDYQLPAYKDKNLDKYYKENEQFVEKKEVNGLEVSVKTEAIKPKKTEEVEILDDWIEVLTELLELHDYEVIASATK